MITGCVVVAAGRGERAGLGYNKVFADLGGRSVLSRTLDRLYASGRIDDIVLVLAKDDFPAYAELISREGECPLISAVVVGGRTRRESVYNGLCALKCDIVLVHDAVRPFVTDEIIANVINDALAFSTGIISTPVTDTVKFTDAAGYALETPDRSRLCAVQTPQAFDYAMIRRAHELCPDDPAITDDAAIFERVYSGVRLSSARSARANIKLTTPEDFDAARRQFLTPRMGTGYDVHRLSEGRALILCGVRIPFEKGLLGHSDADVALHALIDALLGAAALGDIGRMFPDSDARYRDISSLTLLRQASQALTRAGFFVGSCDITIVCQRPRLAPHIDEMRRNIASTLRIHIKNVSVKATTTESLGFEGEGLGISAQAAATVFGGGIWTE